MYDFIPAKASDIPILSKAIKYVEKKVNGIEKDYGPYFINLFTELLTNEATCFVRLGDKRQLLMLLITKIMADKVSGEKLLYIQSMYSWKNVNMAQWENDRDFLVALAKQEECKCLVFESSNPRIWEITEAVGFNEKHRTHVYNIGE